MCTVEGLRQLRWKWNGLLQRRLGTRGTEGSSQDHAYDSLRQLRSEEGCDTFWLGRPPLFPCFGEYADFPPVPCP